MIFPVIWKYSFPLRGRRFADYLDFHKYFLRLRTEKPTCAKRFAQAGFGTQARVPANLWEIQTDNYFLLDHAAV